MVVDNKDQGQEHQGTPDKGLVTFRKRLLIFDLVFEDKKIFSRILKIFHFEIFEILNFDKKMLIVIKQENVQTGGLNIGGHLAIGQLAQVASQGGQTQSQPRTPSAGGTIWKAADYLLEKELLTFALEHRQVSL